MPGEMKSDYLTSAFCGAWLTLLRTQVDLCATTLGWAIGISVNGLCLVKEAGAVMAQWEVSNG